MKAATAKRSVGLLLFSGYVLVGLAASAILSISKLAVVFAMLGLSYSLLCMRRVPGMYLAYLAVYILMISTLLWADKQDWQLLGNYATAACGALFVAAAIRCGWLTPCGLLLMLCVPFVVNLVAYVAGVNYTAVLYDIDAQWAVRRFSGLIGHPNTFVMRTTLPLVVLVFLSSSGYVAFRRRLIDIAVFAACASSALFSVYTSGSKKGLLVVAICLIFWAASLLIRGGLLMRVRAFALIGGVGAAAFLLLMQLEVTDIEAVRRFQGMLSGRDASTDERSFLVALGWRIFWESPIYGHGLGQFAYLSRMGYYAHNNLIELLVSGGIILAFAYYSFMVHLLLVVYRRIRSALPIVFLIIIFLVYDATGVSASDRASQLLVGILIAVAVRAWPDHASIEGMGARRHA